MLILFFKKTVTFEHIFARVVKKGLRLLPEEDRRLFEGADDFAVISESGTDGAGHGEHFKVEGTLVADIDKTLQ